MADAKSEIRYLTPPSVDVKKKKYCRFKKSGIKYIDSYLDLEEKLKAEAAKEERMYQLEQKQQRMLNNEPEQTKNGGYKFGSPKDTLRRLQMEVKERKRKQNDDEMASFEEMM